jgi:hypothetical protein
MDWNQYERLRLALRILSEVTADEKFGVKGQKPVKARNFDAMTLKKRSEKNQRQSRDHQSVGELMVPAGLRPGLVPLHDIDIPSQGQEQDQAAQPEGKGKPQKVELGEREKRDIKRQDDRDGILAPMDGRFEVVHGRTLPQMSANSYGFL